MNTEADLRTPLSARADEVSDELDTAEALIATALQQAQQQAPRHRRTLLTSLAAAAAVATLVVVPVVIGGRGNDAPTAPSATTSGRLTAPVVTPTAPATPTSPLAVRVPPAATVTSSPSVATKQRQAATDGSVTSTTITNLIGVGIARSTQWDLRPDVEYVSVQMPGNLHASIAAFAPAAGFSASRISGAQPVTVAGKPGWFGDVSDWPANGRPDPASGKQDGALPSVAWRLGTTWVVVQSDDSTVIGPAKLTALAEALRITDRPPALRLPFTVGYLPKNFTVDGFAFYQPVAGDPFRPSSGVSLSATGTSLAISLIAQSDTVDVGPMDGARQVTASAHGFVLKVNGTNVSAQQLDRVLSGTVVSANPAGSAANWPLLKDALPRS